RGSLLLRFQRRDRRLQLGHLGHQLVGERVVFLGLGLANLLRGGVAARLRLLEPGDGATAALVDAQKRPDQRVIFRRRHTAPPEPTGELLPILATPFDVMHGAGASRSSWPNRPPGCPQMPGNTGTTDRGAVLYQSAEKASSGADHSAGLAWVLAGPADAVFAFFSTQRTDQIEPS